VRSTALCAPLPLRPVRSAPRRSPATAHRDRRSVPHDGGAAAAGGSLSLTRPSRSASGPARSMTCLCFSPSPDWLVHLPFHQPAALRSLREPTSWPAVEGTRHRRWRKPGGSRVEPPGPWRRVGGGEWVANTLMSHRENGPSERSKKKGRWGDEKTPTAAFLSTRLARGVRRAVSEGRGGERGDGNRRWGPPTAARLSRACYPR
jgi:hypothetical protein